MYTLYAVFEITTDSWGSTNNIGNPPPPKKVLLKIIFSGTVMAISAYFCEKTCLMS